MNLSTYYNSYSATFTITTYYHSSQKLIPILPSHERQKAQQEAQR